MEEKRVIFVDDDVVSLKSLRRMLIKMPNQWEFEFADSGESALDILKKEPFDVVVADMRMPKMDGAQLLTKIKEIYPGMVRIILSGHSSKDMIIDSIGPCHQFLAKPCQSDVLINTIKRACALRELLGDESLQTSLAKLEGIPSVPQIYVELNAEIKSPTASLRKVSQIIAKDMGMSVKILQLVNSAFFGLPRHISNIEQAVSLLGMEIISALVLSTKVFSLFKAKKIEHFSIEWLTNHNFIVGNFAKIIAQEEGCSKKICEQAFLAGLLHDIGKLILCTIHGELYGDAVAHAEDEAIEITKSEYKFFNSSHAGIGAYLLGLWGLPDPVIEAIAFHHNPGHCLGSEFSPLAAVHAADVLYYNLNPTTKKVQKMGFDKTFLENLDVWNKVDVWRELCQNLSATGEKNE
ncbi:MAG: HDOD domain-containing protein [Calditrichaeota bacterium]|nr:MAG: HDOD domain-containing protein [Calditrichota bacterium]